MAAIHGKHHSVNLVRFPAAWLSLLGIVLASALSAGSDDRPGVRVAYIQKIHYAPTIIAFKDGLFEASGLPVRPLILPAGSGILAAEALISGSADAAVMGDAPAIYAAASGKPVKIVMRYGGGEKMHRIIAGMHSGVHRARDLIGKKIAVHFGSSTHGGLLLYLKKNGLDRRRIRIMNLNPGDMPEALATRQIDAVAGSEPIPSTVEMKVAGSYELATLSGLGNSYPLVLLVSGQLIRNRPDRVKRLVEIHALAVDLMNQRPRRAAELIARSTGASPAFELKVMQTLEWGVHLKEDVRESLQQTADFLVNIQKIPRKIDINEYIDGRFVK